MLFQKTISTLPFKRWVWRDEENRFLFAFSAPPIIIAFVWLKLIYPFPNFMPPDSVNYIEAADRLDLISFWPTGYSLFLWIVHSITSSHLVLVTLQYILLTISLLYFLFTIRYLFSPKIWLYRILLALSICNPLVVHIANFVSSDCLFITLSLVWITQLLWIMHRSNIKFLLVHALVLASVFTVRYASLYYPLVSIAIIVFGRMPRKVKTVGIVSVSLAILTIIGFTQYEYKKKTGTVQYSAFGGWQLAANALYAYTHAEQDNPKSVGVKFAKLQAIVNIHMDSLRHLKNRPDEEIGIYYLWNFKSPLRTYMKQKTKVSSERYFYQWARMAPLYAAYGRFLISRHPELYIKYFIWPNLKRYFLPPPFFMGYYNRGNRSVSADIAKWFHWKSKHLPIKSEDLKIEWVYGFSILFAIINILFFVLSFICICSRDFKTFTVISKKLIVVSLAIVLINALFGAITAPIELRYEVFAFIIMLPLTSIYMWHFVNSLQLSNRQTSIINTVS